MSKYGSLQQFLERTIFKFSSCSVAHKCIINVHNNNNNNNYDT